MLTLDCIVLRDDASEVEVEGTASVSQQSYKSEDVQPKQNKTTENTTTELTATQGVQENMNDSIRS